MKKDEGNEKKSVKVFSTVLMTQTWCCERVAIVRLGFTVIDDEHWREMESLDLQLEKLS